MGMSSYIMDIEEQFWDKVAVFIKEAEHPTEAMSKAVALGKTEVPFLGVADIEDGVGEMWNEYWSQYT